MHFSPVSPIAEVRFPLVPEGTILGIPAKSVDERIRRTKRKARSHLQDTAALLLPFERVAHGFDIQGAAQAGNYISKWGAAEELALNGSKLARDPEKGRTIWQLLDVAGGAADKEIRQDQAASLWQSYAREFKGKRQLVWSRGLKARSNITELSDGELAATLELREELASPIGEIGRVTGGEWRSIIKAGLRIALLEAVELDGRAGFERVLWQIRRTCQIGTVPRSFI